MIFITLKTIIKRFREKNKRKNGPGLRIYENIGVLPPLGLTVNSEIFARIQFSRKALKDILATFKFRD